MNKRLYYLSADIIRIIAILGVVIIHTTNAVYTRVDFFGGTMWWITILLDSLSRISIPLFLLLSGYLLLEKDESLQQSIKRIMSRIAIPLLFWTIFYIWFGTGIPSLNRLNLFIFPKIFFADVYHLYYLVIIIGLYFVSPMIRAYLRSTTYVSQKFLMNLFLILGMSEVLFQFVFQGCLSQNFFTWWIPYTGLFVAGYVLGKNVNKLNFHKLIIGYFIGLIATISFNYLHYYLLVHKSNFLDSAGCLSHYTDHYLSINVVLMSLCAFLILLRIQYKFVIKSAIFSTFVKSLAKCTFGIYLIHPVVARILEIQFHLAVDFSSLSLGTVILLKFILVFAVSYLITLIACRIPIIKFIFGEKVDIPALLRQKN